MKIGDVVRMRGGGSPMTVCDHNETHVKCEWFKSDLSVESKTFFLSQIELVDDKPAPKLDFRMCSKCRITVGPEYKQGAPCTAQFTRADGCGVESCKGTFGPINYVYAR